MSYKVVKEFEETIAEYAGSKYAVSVDSCTNAIFLCLKYLRADYVCLPRRTYPGVACAAKNAGCDIEFLDYIWQGAYELYPHNIIDSALRFQRDMYLEGSFYCLSFHIKKNLPIGRGGMILTDSLEAYEWLKKARFDGRSECALKDDPLSMTGWNMYITPEQAARGLMLFNVIKDKQLPDLDFEEQDYPDLKKFEVYK